MKALSIRAWSDASGRASLFLAWIAGVFLVLMMALITAAVIMRYIAGSPILGVNEIVQLNAVAIAMLALPYTTHSATHVRADIFDPALGRWGRLVADLITRTLSIIVLWFLVDRARLKALDALEYGDATNMLGLPIWPFYALLALGMAACAVIFALQMLTVLATRKPFGEARNV